MMIIVAYDISKDDRRDAVAKTLFSMGFTRIQRSLYLGRGGLAKARDVARRLEELIDENTDVVDIILVPDHYMAKRIRVGKGVPLGAKTTPSIRVV